MLKTVPKARASHRLAASFDVEIAGVATAVPPHRLKQADAARRAERIFPHLAAHQRLFSNTGIETRYTCEPPEWYDRGHGWEARTDVFLCHALTLLEEVAERACDAASIELQDIRAIVVNTFGLAIPSLDAKLMNRLALHPSVERLPIFGLGCGGGVAGLARAARYAQAMPEPMCCFSPSICAASAFASTIRAWRCSCPRRCSATARPASSCAT